jgi:hypothetical protein
VEEAGVEADVWARGEGKKEKTMVQLQNSKTKTSRAPKITKNLQKQDKIIKNTMQQQALKKLF